MKPLTNVAGWALVLTKISRPELGRQLDLSKQAIHKWKQLPLEYVVKVEKITGIPREWILPEHAEFFKPSSKRNPLDEKTKAR